MQVEAAPIREIKVIQKLNDSVATPTTWRKLEKTKKALEKEDTEALTAYKSSTGQNSNRN